MPKLSLSALVLLTGTALAAPAWARDYVADGRAALDKGDYKTAQIQLRNAVRDKPDDAQARYLLARVDLSVGDAVAGEKEARAARDLGYDEPAAIMLLGEAYLAQGKVAPLLKDFTVTGKNAKADAATQVVRSYALLAQRNVDDAAAAAAAAEQAAPDMAEPKLAQARVLLAKNDLDGADAKVGAALKADPASTEALLQRAQIQRLRQDPKGAVATLDDLLKKSPGAVGARLERATLLTAMNEDARAKEDVAAVEAVVPNNLQATYLRANLLTRQKDYVAADALLARIEPALGGLPRGYLLQAGVKDALGQTEQARDAAQKYAARVPGDVEGGRLLAQIEMRRRNPQAAVAALQPAADGGRADAAALELLARADVQAGHLPDAVKAYGQAIEKAPEQATLHAQLGDVKVATGDITGGLAELTHALELSPKDVTIAEQLYQAAIGSGDLANADRARDAIARAQPDGPVAANVTGLLQMQRLDYAGARKTFEAVDKAHPDFAPAKINLARLAALEGRPADENAILDAQLKADPATEPALSMRLSDLMRAKDWGQAEALLRAAMPKAKDKIAATVRLASLFVVAKEPGKAVDTLGTLSEPERADPRALAVAAEAYGGAGQAQSARDTLSKLVDREPQAVNFRRQLAARALDAGDVEQARSVLTAGLALDPRNLTLMQDLVGIDLKQSGADAALQTADRMIEQNKDFPQIRGLRGDTMMIAGKYDEAAKEYADAQKAVPGDFFLVRQSDALLRAGKRDESIKVLRDWLGAHPDDVQVMERLSEFAIADKDYPRAQKLLESVVTAAPRATVALNNLAWVYQQQKDKRAEDTARRAFLIAPGGQTADTLGWILVSAGRAKEAMGLMRQADAETQGDPRVKYHYAVGLNDTGRKQDAIAVLKPLVEGDAKFDEKPDAQKLLQTLGKGA